VLPERVLMVCTWRELQQLVCGDVNIDLNLLREMTEYVVDIRANVFSLRR